MKPRWPGIIEHYASISISEQTPWILLTKEMFGGAADSLPVGIVRSMLNMKA